MRVSFNEIETMLYKAGMGAGLPVGVAQDVASAGCWLSQAGVDGVAVTLQLLARGQEAREEGRERILDEAAKGLLFDEVLAVDELVAQGNGARVAIDFVPVPGVLIGLLGVAARDHGTAFKFASGDKTIVIRSGATDLPDLPGPGSVEVSAVSRTAAVGPAAVAENRDSAIVCDAAWSSVLDLAERTYVPASPASREHGAGAGLIDND